MEKQYIGFGAADILLPDFEKVDGTRWAVVACDQYTSEPQYWEAAEKIVGDAPLVKGRYADSLEPGFEAAKKELGATAKSDEDVLSYIAFPNLAETYFEERQAKEDNVVTYTIVEA